MFGDNHVGWIPARVAVADDRDLWFDNNVLSGRHCVPYNGWIEPDEFVDPADYPLSAPDDEWYYHKEKRDD